jgi:stress-induced morphogen
MLLYETIINHLNNGINVKHLFLENESSMHNVPPNSETHFKLVLVSDNFLGLSKVQRHQMIYKILLETMKQIHALSIQAFTIEEYNKNPLILESPDCSNNK